MQTILRYFGGKGYLARKIVPILEDIPHCTYVEPFGGSAMEHSLLRGCAYT